MVWVGWIWRYVFFIRSHSKLWATLYMQRRRYLPLPIVSGSGPSAGVSTCYDKSKVFFNKYFRLPWFFLSFLPDAQNYLHNLLFVVLPQSTYSKSRKWCQHPTLTCFYSQGRKRHTPYSDINGKDIFRCPKQSSCYSITPTTYGCFKTSIARIRTASLRATATIAFFLLPVFFLTRSNLFNKTGSRFIARQAHWISQARTLTGDTSAMNLLTGRVFAARQTGV